MNVLQHYQPSSHLFASPNGTVMGHGCLERVHCSNQHQQLGAKAQELLQHYPQTPLLFGVIPFHTDQPAQLIVPQHVAQYEATCGPPLESYPNANPLLSLQAQPSAAEFETWVQEALQRLAPPTDLKKLVMARHLTAQLKQKLDRRALLSELWAKNPQGYTYSFALDNDPDPATFLGASPELLLRKQGAKVYLNPLAGTALRQPEDSTADQAIAHQLLTSAKDQREHAYVIENILTALRPFCDSLEAAPTPNLVATATLWHLSTEIHGQLKAPYADALQLALAIHPTPAVCGHPTLAARTAIEHIENIDRGFFAGAVGWINQAGDGEWAVAIRCAHYKHHQLKLSAGAGVVLGSDPRAERIETGNKLRTLLNALHTDPSMIQEGITA